MARRLLGMGITRPPPGWVGCAHSLCEIWTPSSFVRDSLVRLVDRPIYVVPHHVPARPERTRTVGMRREALPFTVLVMADSRSSLSRKNPEGALRAFRTAFGGSPAARLVLKLNGSAGGADAASQALSAGAADALSGGNVEVINSFLDADALEELFRGADVLLSLHRAEGFGIPMLEAMAHGLPVVATGWSGNLEFMDETNSHLVPYQLVPVRDAASIYRGSTWAEPDIHVAAQALRRLAEDPAHYARMASAAHLRARALVRVFPLPRPPARRLCRHDSAPPPRQVTTPGCAPAPCAPQACRARPACCRGGGRVGPHMALARARVQGSWQCCDRDA